MQHAVEGDTHTGVLAADDGDPAMVPALHTWPHGTLSRRSFDVATCCLCVIKWYGETCSFNALLYSAGQ